MFINPQFKILYLLHKNGQMSKADILNHFRVSKGLDVNALLKDFEANGHVRRSSDCYSLTNSGRVLRSELVYNEVRYWITTGIAVAAALKAYLL
jgi:predicted transcriptional regulator